MITLKFFNKVEKINIYNNIYGKIYNINSYIVFIITISK